MENTFRTLLSHCQLLLTKDLINIAAHDNDGFVNFDDNDNDGFGKFDDNDNDAFDIDNNVLFQEPKPVIPSHLSAEVNLHY